MSEIFQVFLIGLTRECTIDVATSAKEFQNTTIKKLKELVVNKLKVTIGKSLDPEEISLMYDGKQLEGTATLDHYGIKPKSTIFLWIREPGGTN